MPEVNLFINVVAFENCLSYLLNFRDHRLYFEKELFYDYDTDEYITATDKE